MTTHELPIPEATLLKAITRALSQYAVEADPYVLFDGLLETLLELTGSEYGFIGEVFYSEEGNPYIKSYATTNIAWSDATQQLYEETEKKGMIFARLESLYGAVLTTGKLIISNKPASDSRSGGLPPGHPPLNTFMGIPFFSAGKLLGVVGIANRENGYHQCLANSLSPFLETCGALIQIYRSNLEKHQLEEKLHQYNEQLSAEASATSFGDGYKLTQSPLALTRGGYPVLLTPKEMDLLALLVKNTNQVVHCSVLEKYIWKNVVVSESSLRSLVRRLRKKLPDITIDTVRGFGFMLRIPD
jgi:hypothetical protein